MAQQTEELGHGKIGKLLFTYALPAIIATTASSLYNVIDRIFIGQGVGAIALAGLGLTLPIMNLATALGTLVGTLPRHKHRGTADARHHGQRAVLRVRRLVA